jgi:hypothetical protein
MERIASYHSPRAAASDVASGATGCMEIDSLDHSKRPRELVEWLHGKPESLGGWEP